MSKKHLYILTENLNFFYRLKKELDRNSIKYTVLNIGGRIPTFSSIILSTSEEIDYVYDEKNKFIILPYITNQSFEQYIKQVIATYRIGYKEKYSNLTFAIDPGTKYIGLATFLDDFFLESHTFYSKEETITYIEKISKLLQFNNSNPLNLQFKFGSGIILLIHEFINELFYKLDKKYIKKVYLIDELRSSKLKLIMNNKKFPKHESAAILLALRAGIEITPENFNHFIYKYKKVQNKGINGKEGYFQRFQTYNNEIKAIAEDVINGLLSYKEAMNRINSLIEKEKFNLIQ